MIRLFIYALIFVIWAYSLAYEIQFVPVGPGQNRFHKLKYLTEINMLLQTAYSFLCVVRALVDECTKKPGHGPHTQHPESPNYYKYSKLHSICDGLYGCLAFPVAAVVSILFWSLYAIDRELVYPKALDEVIPHWLNHVMHTAPVFFLLVDTLLTCHRLPNRKTGIKICTLFSILYYISILVWHEVDGVWVYPLFEVLDYFQRALFFLFATVFIVFLYLAVDTLNRLVWGPACHPPSKSVPEGRFYSQANVGRKKARKD